MKSELEQLVTTGLTRFTEKACQVIVIVTLLPKNRCASAVAKIY